MHQLKTVFLFVVIGISLAPARVLASAPTFPRRNIELLARVSLGDLGGGAGGGNDIWGWTDSLTGREYAIVGRKNGTGFADITDPTQPVYVGNLASHTGISTWRDMKVFNDHVFVVSDGNGPHGMQVFDLTNLRGVASPQEFSETAHFPDFRSAHNVAINEDTGFAYAVGANLAGGGLYMIDINDPTHPSFAGQFSSHGYIHDTQVVTYQGPDQDYAGRELAFSSNLNALSIVDVTDKAAPTSVSKTTYPQSGYAHQGWLSEDHRFFFMNDERDENVFQLDHTRTHIWELNDLDDPRYVGFHEGLTQSIDHNLYVKDNYIYQANYSSGLRVLEMTDPANGILTEVAYLDTFQGNPQSFDGAWSVYPFFESGTIIVNDRKNGLFVARLDILDPDLNGDGSIGCDDIDSLVAAIASADPDLAFDLTHDGVVDLEDRDRWLQEAGARTLDGQTAIPLGDANLDGVVDGDDFIRWHDNKFTQQAAWCAGDFNADGFVDGSDFIIWHHGFVAASATTTVATAVAVPEPTGALLWTLGLAVWLTSRRSTSSHR